MGLVGIFTGEEALQKTIEKQLGQRTKYQVKYIEKISKMLDFLNFDMPELVIVNCNDSSFNYLEFIDRIRGEAWLHSFGIIGLYNRENGKEDDYLRAFAGTNILAIYEYGQLDSHLKKSIEIIEENQQIVMQYDFAQKFADKSRGSFYIENDPFTAPLYAGLAATGLAQRGVVDPERKIQLQIALTELIMNGIEHGNCKITFEDKNAYLMQGMGIHELIRERMKDKSIAETKVQFEWESSGDHTVFSIRDQGDGFDVQGFLEGFKDNDPELLHGRGIMMARALASKLQYNTKGNEVRLTFKHDEDAIKAAPLGFRDEEVIRTNNGDIIFKEGEESDHLYYISSGSFEVTTNGVVVGTLDASDVFMGEMSFLLNNKRSATVMATNIGRLVKVTRKAFMKVVKDYPHYGIFLSKLLAKKLVRANQVTVDATKR
jgi:hypothetical protein